MSRGLFKRCRCWMCKPQRLPGPWRPRSKRERVELSEPIDADSRDDDFEGIAAELRLMAHEITRDLARNGHHLRPAR